MVSSSLDIALELYQYSSTRSKTHQVRGEAEKTRVVMDTLFCKGYSSVFWKEKQSVLRRMNNMFVIGGRKNGENLHCIEMSCIPCPSWPSLPAFTKPRCVTCFSYFPLGVSGFVFPTEAQSEKDFCCSCTVSVIMPYRRLIRT